MHGERLKSGNETASTLDPLSIPTVCYSASKPRTWLILTNGGNWIRTTRHEARMELRYRHRLTRRQAEAKLGEVIDAARLDATYQRLVRERYAMLYRRWMTDTT
jgi:hypothetical protein